MSRFVAVIVATFRRAPELKRLLRSLEKVKTPLSVLVVDNAGDPQTEEAVRGSGVDAHWLFPGENLGCGGGLAFGERAALERFGSRLTHLWMLDDDTVVHETALETLIDAMEAKGAALGCPMILNSRGRLSWPPGVLNRQALKDLDAGQSAPEQFISRFGSEPIPFSWAPGISLLVTREVVEQLGTHQDIFWIRGEDLEFSLRITARFPGVYVPGALVEHLPPAVVSSPQTQAAERVKHEAMLQNSAYIIFRLPYGRRIARHLPGNLWRYLKLWGVARLPNALRAFWRGAIEGLPVGATRKNQGER